MFNPLFANRPRADSELYFLNPRLPKPIKMSGRITNVRIISNVIISFVSYNFKLNICRERNTHTLNVSTESVFILLAVYV